MTPTHHTLVALLAITAAAFGMTSGGAQAAGTRAGATRAAKRHVVSYVKRYGIVLRTSELDLQCSVVGRSRWKCFVKRQRGPVHRHAHRGLLDQASRLPSAHHQHRVRRVTSVR